MKQIDKFIELTNISFEDGTITKEDLYDAYHKSNPKSMEEYHSIDKSNIDIDALLRWTIHQWTIDQWSSPNEKAEPDHKDLVENFIAHDAKEWMIENFLK